MMRHVVMPLDVIEVHGIGDAVVLIEVFEIAEQVPIVDDAADIAFEVSMIDGVKADERDEQAPICLNKSRSKEISLIRHPGLQDLQGVEETSYRALIGMLSGCEPCAINPIIDVLVDERIQLIDLVSQSLRV